MFVTDVERGTQLHAARSDWTHNPLLDLPTTWVEHGHRSRSRCTHVSKAKRQTWASNVLVVNSTVKTNFGLLPDWLLELYATH